MKELEEIIKKYFSKDYNATVYYNIEQETFNKMIMNMKQFEKPDIVSIYDKKIIGIEHFEFDSYKTNKKGSKFQFENAQMEKRIDSKLKEILEEAESAVVHDNIKGKASLDNYYSNFIANFNNHYNKIESYEKNIKANINSENKDIEFWFFVEDVTPLGNYFLNEKRNTMLLNPLYSKKVRELLNKSNKIKGIILGQYAMNSYTLTIIINEKSVLEKFEKEHKEIEEKDYLNFTPNTTGFAIKMN